MSEEQNLLIETVAAAPQRAKHPRKKAAKKVNSGDADGTSASGAVAGGGNADGTSASGAIAGGGNAGGESADSGGRGSSGHEKSVWNGGEESGNRRRDGGGGPVAVEAGGSVAVEGGGPVAVEAGGGANGGGANGGGEGPAASMSKSRRRRRKRKNRAAQAAGAQGAGAAGQDSGVAVGTIEASGQAAAAGEAPMREFRQASSQNGQANGQSNGVMGQGFQQNGHGPNGGQGFGQNSNGQGSRRNKKKKFRRAGEGGGGSNGPSQPRPEPGNSFQGSTSGMNGRRNRKQQGGGQSRGPRTFVGPMDHSYREANGNFADVPASTIQVNGGRHRSSNGHRHYNEDRMPPELMHNNRPIAIPEDAPTHIYFFIEDLFFTAKIQEVAKQQGVKVAFMKPDKDVVAHLSELHDHEHPSLIVFDLNNAAAKPLTLIPKLKNKLKKGTSILGFLSHLQGDLKLKAVEAGCHTVMPRSAFSQNLPNLLRRYGVEDEHEPNFNQ